VAAVLSYLMPCPAVPPREPALLPAVPLGPWPRTFCKSVLNGQPQTPSQTLALFPWGSQAVRVSRRNL